jgi:hypothetical protein
VLFDHSKAASGNESLQLCCVAGCRDFTVRLAKEVILMMFIGTDTTAYTLTRCMVWLSKYPEWLQALNDEQDRLAAKYGAELSREVCAPSPQHLLTTFGYRPVHASSYLKVLKKKSSRNILSRKIFSWSCAVGMCGQVRQSFCDPHVSCFCCCSLETVR